MMDAGARFGQPTEVPCDFTTDTATAARRTSALCPRVTGLLLAFYHILNWLSCSSFISLLSF